MSEEADQSDEKLLQMSLQLNHIRNDPSSLTSPFHCNMCKVPFSGIAPLRQHLLSVKHKKKVAQRDAVAAVLDAPSLEKNLLEMDDHIVRPSHETQETLIGQELLQISGDVKEALEKGDIVEDTESTTSPYQCKVCHIPLSGLAPLKEHVKSGKHIKKASERSIYLGLSSSRKNLLEEDCHIVRPSQETQGTLIGQELLQISGDVKEAIEKGDIVEDKESTTSPYKCNVCHIPVTGLAPLKEHVKSAKHVKKASERSIHLEISSSIDFPDGEPKFKTSTPKNHYIQPVFPSSNMVQNALNKGHVVEDRGSLTSPYQCKVCHVPLSGLAPLEDHIKSAKHLWKTKETYIQTDSPDCSFEISNIEISTPQHHSAQPVNHNASQVQDAFIKGYIVGDPGSTTGPFQCKACHVELSGLAPLDQHVTSARHIQKTMESSLETFSVNLPEDPAYLGVTTNPEPRPRDKNAVFVDEEKEKLLQKLLQSKNPEDIHKANALIKSMVKEDERKIESASRRIVETTNVGNASSKEQDIYQTNMEQNLIQDARDSISAPVSSNDLVSQFVDTASSVANETDPVSKSFELGHVRSASGFSVGTYFCEICQVPLTGEAPLHQHINSPNHAKKLRNKGGAFDMSGLKIALLNTGIIEQDSPMVKKAIEDGHVCKDELSLVGAYFCKVCQVPLTGVKPLEQHLLGSNHLVCTRKNYNFRNLPVENSEYAENEDALKISEPVKLPIYTNTLDTSSTPVLPIWADYKVITCENPKQPDENTYKNLSNPRGHVYIFNNVFQNDSNNFRPGANCDSIILKYIFERMSYRVYINNDLSRDETYKKVDEIQKDKELKKVDSFIMVILSHGEDSTKFYANDMELIHIDNIRYKFIDGKCPQLKGKPKIFMCNYCRGNIKQSQLQTDAPHNYPDHEAPADMVTLHASIDGFLAIRHALKGTIFVQSLCETLSKHAHNMEFRLIYRILSNTMKEKLGTTPELQDFVFKDFYFNPTSI